MSSILTRGSIAVDITDSQSISSSDYIYTPKLQVLPDIAQLVQRLTAEGWRYRMVSVLFRVFGLFAFRESGTLPAHMEGLPLCSIMCPIRSVVSALVL